MRMNEKSESKQKVMIECSCSGLSITRADSANQTVTINFPGEKKKNGTGGDVAPFPGAGRDFSPRVNFQCRLSYVCPYTPVCNHMHLHLCAR